MQVEYDRGKWEFGGAWEIWQGRKAQRASSPVYDEIELRYMSYSGSHVKGKRKGLCGFWDWNNSVTVQAVKLGRGLGQAVEDSGGCRKCQRGPEPYFSLPLFFLENFSFIRWLD